MTDSKLVLVVTLNGSRSYVGKMKEMHGAPGIDIDQAVLLTLNQSSEQLQSFTPDSRQAVQVEADACALSGPGTLFLPRFIGRIFIPMSNVSRIIMCDPEKWS